MGACQEFYLQERRVLMPNLNLDPQVKIEIEILFEENNGLAKDFMQYVGSAIGTLALIEQENVGVVYREEVSTSIRQLAHVQHFFTKLSRNKPTEQ
jgi:hypothetical protein